MATFNSKEYAWADVNIVLLGKPLVGVQSVSYSMSQDKEYIYGRGNNPIGIQSGNKSYDGSISVLQTELEGLIRAAGENKTITDLPPFDIVVSYASSDGVIVTDILKACQFNSVEKSMHQGSKFMEISLPIMILNIEFNK